jgi:hypothetical protein
VQRLAAQVEEAVLQADSSGYSCSPATGSGTLGLQALDHLEYRAIHLGNDLHHAIMIAQVDEHEITMIPLSVDPARNADDLSDMGRARFGAGVGAVCVHDDRFWPGCSR